MKKAFLCFFFAITLFASHAQTSVYHPFPDSNAVWNIKHSPGLISCHGNPLGESYSYTFAGDTTFKSQVYHKLTIPFVLKTDTCSFWHKSPGYAGCIRQNVAAKKVYFIAPGDTTEYTLYDFNLQVGDAVVVPPGVQCFGSGDTIQSIDSILIGSDYRKEWNIYDFFITGYSIIEGIGNTTGLLEPCGHMPDGDAWELQCFDQNDTVLYHPNTAESCNVILSVNQSSEAHNAISIYPIPATGNITIALNKKIKEGELNVYNAMGEKVFSEPLMDDKDKTLILQLSSGIYFLQVTNGLEIWRSRFMKE